MKAGAGALLAATILDEWGLGGTAGLMKGGGRGRYGWCLLRTSASSLMGALAALLGEAGVARMSTIKGRKGARVIKMNIILSIR